MNDIRPCGNNEKWCESCVSKGKCNYTQNTKNQCVIAELESLNTEIEEVKDWVGCGNKRHFSDVEVHSIINKRISELKGENNE